MSTFLKPFLLISMWLTAVSSWGLVTVKGRLASATDDTPLAGATVRLLTLPDSTLLIGSFSDKEGQFTISSSRVKPPSDHKKSVQVLLVATYMGYQTIQKVINVRARTKEYDLKDLFMQEDSRILSETFVNATPPPIMIKEDTVEYFAASYKTQPDATAEDLLKRLPGVEVAEDGSITAQGESVQQVYVDGKEFFGTNTQVTTKNLTADMIESVQVVDMQTEEARLTGIDDGERRKVINLKLKPKMRRGWFGNLAGAWGMGRDISDRFEGRGMVGYFRGNSQNAAYLNANNTNNAGFGDLGDRMMSGSAMRGMRRSGARGDGINTSWSAGVNIGYDEGNRMRDPESPLAINGNVMYGGSSQDEYSKSHRSDFWQRTDTLTGGTQTGTTETDSYNTGHNESQNLQVELRFEKSWGDAKANGKHRVQINPSFGFNRTETEDYGDNHVWTTYGDESESDSVLTRYTTQSQYRSDMNQRGYSFGIGGTYSFTKRTDLGRRRTSVTINVSERINDGNRHYQSFTTYDTARVDFNILQDVASHVMLEGDTLIDQLSDEDSHHESYRLRLTHVEPIAEGQTIELSAAASLSDQRSENMYYFWDGTQWADSINGRSNTEYSSDTWLRNVNYTLSVSYRLKTDKYNLSTGIDVLPQSQSYKDYFDHSRDYTRHYVNYSPRLEYRYKWSRHQNLRIKLNGQMSQPSMSQLQARKNQSSATHVSLGNPDLDPSYTADFNASYRSFNDQTYATFDVGMSARASFNNRVTKRWYSEDFRTDTTQTVNLSGIGGLSANGYFRGSWPFYDNIWYVTSNTNLGYSESDGYASARSTEALLNTTRSYTGSEQAGIAYRSERLNVELRGHYNIQYSEATVATSSYLGATHNFGVSSHLTAHLPLDFTISSDFNYTARRGYSAGLTRNQSIWNAQLSRTFLKRKNLSAFVKVFDILQQRSAISRQVSATSVVDRETTVLGQFFLVGASIRFNKMGGGQQRGKRREAQGGEDREMPGMDRGGMPIGGGERMRDDRF
ncbi:MAG: TonB-dependent receptor family protein [Bacteroidales bacterium]|nr:TonB-dependent receptor family protein [Bacteroidales bacterium]